MQKLADQIRQLAEQLKQPTTFSQSANKQMASDLEAIAAEIELNAPGDTIPYATLEVKPEPELGVAPALEVKKNDPEEKN